MSKENLEEEIQFLSHFGALDDLYLDIVSPPFQACADGVTMFTQNSQVTETREKSSYAFPSASLEILKQCTSKCSTITGKKTEKLVITEQSHTQLSTYHIIELAAQNFIQSSSVMNHPYGSTLLGHSTEDQKDIQLVQDLLLCAEKVHNQQYNSAQKLLEECCRQCSGGTKTIQRLVHSFVGALCDRINKETGRFSEKDMKNKWSSDFQMPCAALIALHQKLPMTQITQFASVQTVADELSGRKKVHIIDLEIRCGVSHTILMQALVARSDSSPVEQFKITALANRDSKLNVEEAGVRLKTLADSLSLNFSYHIVMLEDVIINPQRDLFSLDYQEAVVVQVTCGLWGMIRKPNQLEMLMRAIKNTNPCAMIVTETEANVNSPVFVNRFVEALFFYGTYFDYLQDSLKNDVEDRTFAETNFLSPAISNVVAAEGDERKTRIVSINIWRAFFARFGMVETGLSKLALHHANLVRERFESGDSCTLDLNGKSLVVGWKGTPLYSLSAWRFHGLLSRRKFRT